MLSEVIQIEVDHRREERDQRRPRLHVIDFFEGRLLNFEDEVGILIDPGGFFDDLGTGVFKDGVADERVFARIFLNEDGYAGCDILLYSVWSERDTSLVRRRLTRHANGEFLTR
jgi:hypothetical protein